MGALAPACLRARASVTIYVMSNQSRHPRFLLLACVLFAAIARAQTALDGCPGTPWPATDALARSVPVGGEGAAPRAGRFVGIFYFLWQEHVGAGQGGGKGPYDVAKILAADPDALKKPSSPLWGPIGMYHYWGEPLFGYYRATDPWVIRRHAHLLADAGIDALIFDATNALTYRNVYEKLCAVFSEVRREGGVTPRIAFMVHTNGGQTAQTLYKDLYAPGLFRDLWFVWSGKPLLLCDPAEASPEVREFFTLRRAHWPFEMVNTPYAWHWEAAYPQPYGYTDDPAKPEQVNVSVAQNLRAADGKVTNMSEGNARGRSFHDRVQDRTPGAVLRGHNFQEQWKRAFELDPPFVMVTGWNEWIAGRWGDPKGPPVFVDQYDQEFSRDIEPMRGGHGDNYYYQLVAGVREYKGAPPLPNASAAATIAIDGPFDAWRDVAPEFADHVGETIPRDAEGQAGLRYADASGRNDIVAAKVARDARSIYFYARTKEPLAPRGNDAWMWLLIDADRNGATGSEGYEWIANRLADADGCVWLEKNEGAWQWKKTARLAFRARGNELHLAIPRAALGIPEGAPVAIDFKWVDGAVRPGEVMDFYTRGDTAPDGRFRFRYAAP